MQTASILQVLFLIACYVGLGRLIVAATKEGNRYLD
jgi:hypothetical protein